MSKYYKNGFTLAELIIAMMIFGFIAVTLIPNVTSNAERALFTTQLKKVQNDVQQAVLLLVTKNQNTLEFVCSDYDDVEEMSECFRDEIAANLDVFTTFNDSTPNPANDGSCSESPSGLMLEDATMGASGRKVSGSVKDISNPCKQKRGYLAREPKYLNKTDVELGINDAGFFKAANLKNGATVSVYFDSTCTADVATEAIDDAAVADDVAICGYVELDLNATKAPNMVGKDIHYFWIVDKDGLVPFGEIDNFTCGVIPAGGGRYTFPTAAGTTVEQSLGCTHRLMQRGKIDYY